jgi:hypothetical protein
MSQVTSGKLRTPAAAADRPLYVRLVEEPGSDAPAWPRYVLVVVFVLLFFLYAWLAADYVFPESTPLLPPPTTASDVRARLRYPEFASVGDVSYIEMTAINASDRAISGTLVITFDPLAPVSLPPDNRAGLNFARLPPGDRISHRLEFRPIEPWGLPIEDKLPFHLRLLTSDGELETLGEGEIGLMPIPYLSRILTGVRSGVLASLAALLWERIKKWLFP